MRGAGDIALVVNDRHQIHHIRERGYVESPVRIKAILDGILPTGLFERVAARAHPERVLRRTHDPALIDYLKKACASVAPGESIYPYVFPIRNGTRPPRDLAYCAGYYCIDTFTPIHRNAFVAAKRGVDCSSLHADCSRRTRVTIANRARWRSSHGRCAPRPAAVGGGALGGPPSPSQPVSGAKTRRRAEAPSPLCARDSGFTLHAMERSDSAVSEAKPPRERAKRVRTRVQRHRRGDLEVLCRYPGAAPRAPRRCADDQVGLRDDGEVELTFSRPWSDGTTSMAFEPLAFMARLAALIPLPHLNGVRAGSGGAAPEFLLRIRSGARRSSARPLAVFAVRRSRRRDRVRMIAKGA